MKHMILFALLLASTASFAAVSELLITDPAAPEPDPAHNSISQMDLTTVTLSNTPGEILVEVEFSSDFEGVHLVLLMETGYGGSTYGGPGDPFEFPVSYEHPNRPDFVLTYKYTDDDYADLRFWSGEWSWWDDAGREYRTPAQGWVPGINIRPAWITKGSSSVEIAIPLYIFGPLVQPDSISIEVYLTQQVVQFDVIKRSAFDSAPHDSTLDIDFDPYDPYADWSITETPVSLHHYSAGYGIVTDFPAPPILSDAAADPQTVTAGDTIFFYVDVADGGDGIGNVLIDLSPVGGAQSRPMTDDGTGGDQAAGDGTYSCLQPVDSLIPSGEYLAEISAGDASNTLTADTVIAFTVAGAETMIRSFVDPAGDDHGPDQLGTPGLYYVYPGNDVFFDGSYDLLECRIYETAKVVGGEIVPSIAFVVTAGAVPDPAEPGAADWNPLYGDINIQKVDIYIDAFDGGIYAGLPYRQNDFAEWDAWDYAVVMDGWYKGVLVSSGGDTPETWAITARISDRDIVLSTDFDDNTITAIVSKEALGDPSAEDIQGWDIMVVMTGHDGVSTEMNFGDTRWVNDAVSDWQFGGGSNTDYDANIIDLMGSPGTGNVAGRTQSEMLDYTTAEAWERIMAGKTPVVLETTFDITATLLESFMCSGAEEGIEISWTLSEAGETMAFSVTREKDQSGRFLPIEIEILESGDLSYRAIDNDLEPGASYRYSVYVEDEEGARLLFTTERIKVGLPGLTLRQNYPNPFNPATTIVYFVPAKCHVLLEIFDVSGRRVACLVDRTQAQGRYTVEWNGRDPGGNAAGTGVYFYRLKAGKQTVSRKMVLLK
jgi:hypothetical protein